MILKYEVEDWKNKAYRGNDLDRVCSPMLESRYCGVFRRQAWEDGRVELMPRKKAKGNGSVAQPVQYNGN